MTTTMPTAAELRKLLAQAEAAETEAAKVSADDAFVADLADHRVNPVTLGRFLDRVRSAFLLLGIDLEAEDPDGGPARPARVSKASKAPESTDKTKDGGAA